MKSTLETIQTIENRWQTSVAPLLIFIAFISVGIMAALVMVSGSALINFAIISLLAISLCFWKPLAAILLILFWVPIQYMPTKAAQILPQSAVWFDEVMVVGLALASFMRLVFMRTKFVPTPVDLSLLGFILIGAISTVLNGVSPIIAIMGLRGMLQFPLLYYAILNFKLTDRTLRLIIWIIILTALIQIPVTLIQFAIFMSNPTTGINDELYGTFGPRNANSLGWMLSFVAFILIGLIKYDQNLRKKYILILISLLIPFILASSRASYLFFPIILLWLYRRSLFRSAKETILYGGLILVLFCGIFFYYSVTQEELSHILPTRIWKEQTEFQYASGRVLFYPLAWDAYKRYAFNFLTGTGPGTFTSYTGQFFNTKPYQAVGYIFEEFELIQSSVNSQLIATGGEFGPIGLLFYFLALFKLYHFAKKVEKDAADSFWRGVAFGLKGCLIFFSLATIVGNIWETQQVAYYLWVIAAVLVYADRNKSSRALYKSGGIK